MKRVLQNILGGINMLEKTKGFIKENKGKLIVGGAALVTLGYLGYKIKRGDFEDASVVIKESTDGFTIEEA